MLKTTIPRTQLSEELSEKFEKFKKRTEYKKTTIVKLALTEYFENHNI